jgi:hypothetical protein
MLRSSHRIAAFLAFILLAAWPLVGCKSWNERGAKGIGLLPKAAPGEQHFSKNEPANPFVPLGEGILSRKMYEAPGPNALYIEVRDLLVGPRQHSATVNLPGAAVWDVRSGSGTLTTGDQTQQLRGGTTLSLPEGIAFSIANNADEPISIRAYLVRAE